MSATASVRTLRNQYNRLLAMTARGETVTILRRGKPVARLSPLEPPTSVDWSRSAAMSPPGPPIADRKALRMLLAENRGRY